MMKAIDSIQKRKVRNDTHSMADRLSFPELQKKRNKLRMRSCRHGVR